MLCAVQTFGVFRTEAVFLKQNIGRRIRTESGAKLLLLAMNPVWLGTDMFICDRTSLAKNLNSAKRFNEYTVIIVSGNTKQRRCLFKYTMGR